MDELSLSEEEKHAISFINLYKKTRDSFKENEKLDNEYMCSPKREEDLSKGTIDYSYDDKRGELLQKMKVIAEMMTQCLDRLDTISLPLVKKMLDNIRFSITIQATNTKKNYRNDTLIDIVESYRDKFSEESEEYFSKRIAKLKRHRKDKGDEYYENDEFVGGDMDISY